MPERAVLQALVAEGVLRDGGERLQPTRRWQAALARAALRLLAQGAPDGDLRLPIAAALAELLPSCTDAELADRLEAILPFVVNEVDPAGVSGARP